jgi:hypothetical protein
VPLLVEQALRTAFGNRYRQILENIWKHAIPTYIKLLGNDKTDRFVFEQLEMNLGKCKSQEDIKAFEQGLQKGYSRAMKKHRQRDSIVKIQTAKLRIKAAEKRNQFSEDKGILLDDKPKAPKRREMYRTMRKACT